LNEQPTDLQFIITSSGSLRRESQQTLDAIITPKSYTELRHKLNQQPAPLTTILTTPLLPSHSDSRLRSSLIFTAASTAVICLE
jgi:hypothetical protein